MKKLGCKIRFEESDFCSKEYSYLTDIEGLRNGDLVVAHARDEFVIAYFCSYDSSIVEKETTKWVISKIDLSMHYARVANKQKIKLIKEKLETERKKVEETQIYEILAAKSPEISELLKELKALESRWV